MNYSMVKGAQQNKILARLSSSNYSRMSGHLKMVDLTADQVIYEAGVTPEFVYFPTTCTMSLVAHTRDGETSEVAVIGRDGMAGVSLVLGGTSMNHRVAVQCAGRAIKMPADAFRKEVARGEDLQQIALCYVQILITQMSQSIVCTGHHSVSERLSSWLLFNRDALGCDQVKGTHERIADMLSVRRESITIAISKLQASGLVAIGRGKTDILDFDGLAASACECFSLVSTEKHRLFACLDRLGSGSKPDEMASPLVGSDQELLQKFQDAYDFAPVGFVSLDKSGRLIQTNLAGAIMLNIQRSQHSQTPFVEFINPDDQSLFSDFHQEVLSGKCRRHCELMLSANDHRPEIVVRIDATLDELGEECQLVLIDVTEQKAWQSKSYSRNTIGSSKARLTDHFSLVQ